MKWFNNLSLTAKLIGGFAVTMVLLVFTGGLAIWSLGTLDAANTELYEDETVRLGVVGDWSTLLTTYRMELRNLALAETSAQRAEVTETLAALSEEVTRLQNEYEASIQTEVDRKLFDDLLAARQDYLVPARQVADLVQQERIQEAMQLLNGETGRTGDLYSAALDTIAERRVDGAREKAETNTALYHRTRAILIGIIILGVLLAGGIAVFISRWVGSRIRLVVERAQMLQQRDITNLGAGAKAIVRGDLDNRVDYGTEPLNLDLEEEIGTLARAVDGIIESTGSTARNFEEAQNVLRRVVDQTQDLVDSAREGHLEKRAESAGFEGAYTELISGLNALLEAVVRPIHEASGVLEALAARDLTARMEGEYNGDYAKIKRSLNTAIDNLEEALSEVSAASAQVNGASDEIAGGSQDLAEGASEQASSLEETSSSLEEMA
ncbi:MAG: MCP four helix bundle domain-containing protein, partial [Jiangellaceae bacterium]